MKNILHDQFLPYISEVIWSKIINCHYNDPLAGHFGIKKTRKLVTRKISSLPAVKVLKPMWKAMLST